MKATELVESSRHAAGLVPRFARVVAVRSDKQWHECVTTAELRELRARAGGKLASAHLTVSGRKEEGGDDSSSSEKSDCWQDRRESSAFGF